MNRVLAGLVLTFVPAAPAVAAQKPITGTLDQPGLTVIALAANGHAVLTRTKPTGAFKLVPPASRVTLQLRGKDGRYAGPISIAGSGKTLIMGVRAGAQLGRIHVAGVFARVRKAPSKVFWDRLVTARARQSVPVGAGVFGRVKGPAVSAAGAPPGSDSDHDGIPNALDVDDDGDLILDNVDPESAPPAASSGQVVAYSGIVAPFERSLNADAGATPDALDELLKGSAFLALPLPASGAVELDCARLTYCRKGGTGAVESVDTLGDPAAQRPAFPACCDKNGDGHGTLTAAAGAAGRSFLLHPGAGNPALAAGDLLVERKQSGAIVGTLASVFASTPAAAAWADGTSLGALIYPAGETSAGTAAKPLVLHPRPDGHVVLQLAVWRPQRRAFPGEADAFIDLGHLRYSIVAATAPQATGGGGGSAAPGPGPGACSLASYTEADANLAGSGPPAHGYLLDASNDLTVDPNRTLVFSVDLTKCLGDAAITWSPGEVLPIALSAADAGLGHADQVLTLRLAAAA